VSGRIVLHLDKGLGWTAPLFVAGCGDCGTELAAGRRRCPACGTRAARRLPGTTSLNTDLALARGRREFVGRRRTPDRHSAPRSQRAGRR
jgi:hypothetical protein